MSTAIEASCNYFFYEVGYRLGDKSGSYSSKEGLKYLEKYATQLGLNKQSGIELDESSPQVSDETSVPVSYTHLDVYKRQHMHRSIC